MVESVATEIEHRAWTDLRPYGLPAAGTVLEQMQCGQIYPELDAFLSVLDRKLYDTGCIVRTALQLHHLEGK